MDKIQLIRTNMVSKAFYKYFGQVGCLIEVDRLLIWYFYFYSTKKDLLAQEELEKLAESDHGASQTELSVLEKDCCK